MKILVLADTHIPRVAEDLPKKVYDEIERVDMILHAGDFVDAGVYERLKGLKKICAVCGNMDSPELRRTLRQKEVVTAGKFKIGLIHGYGAPAALIETVKSEFSDVDAIVFGHSHSALNSVKNGILFFNPGSPTDTVFAKTNSFGILEVTDKKIEGTIVKL